VVLMMLGYRWMEKKEMKKKDKKTKNTALYFCAKQRKC